MNRNFNFSELKPLLLTEVLLTQKNSEDPTMIHIYWKLKNMWVKTIASFTLGNIKNKWTTIGHPVKGFQRQDE